MTIQIKMLLSQKTLDLTSWKGRAHGYHNPESSALSCMGAMVKSQLEVCVPWQTHCCQPTFAALKWLGIHQNATILRGVSGGQVCHIFSQQPLDRPQLGHSQHGQLHEIHESLFQPLLWWIIQLTATWIKYYQRMNANSNQKHFGIYLI